MAVRAALLFLCLIVGAQAGVLCNVLECNNCDRPKVCNQGLGLLGLLPIIPPQCITTGLPGLISAVLGTVTGLVDGIAGVLTYDVKNPCKTDFVAGLLVNFDAGLCKCSNIALASPVNLLVGTDVTLRTALGVAGAVTVSLPSLNVAVKEAAVFLGANAKVAVAAGLVVKAGSTLNILLNGTVATGAEVAAATTTLIDATAALVVKGGVAVNLGTCLLNGGTLTLGLAQVKGVIGIVGGAATALAVAGNVNVVDEVTVAANAALALGVNVKAGVGATASAGIKVLGSLAIVAQAQIQAALKLTVATNAALWVKASATIGAVLNLADNAVVWIDTRVASPVFGNIVCTANSIIKVIVPSVNAAIAAATTAGVELNVATLALTGVATDLVAKIVLCDDSGIEIPLVSNFGAYVGADLHQALVTVGGLVVRLRTAAALNLNLATPVLATLGRLNVNLQTAVVAEAGAVGNAVVVAGGNINKFVSGVVVGTVDGVLSLKTCALGNLGVAVTTGTSAVATIGAGVGLIVDDLTCEGVEKSIILINAGAKATAGLALNVVKGLSVGLGGSLTVALDAAADAVADVNVDVAAAVAAAVGVKLPNITLLAGGKVVIGAGVRALLGVVAAANVGAGAAIVLGDNCILDGATDLGAAVVLSAFGGVKPLAIIAADAVVALRADINTQVTAGTNLAVNAVGAVGATLNLAGKLAVKAKAAVGAGVTATAGVAVGALVNVKAGGEVALESAALTTGHVLAGVKVAAGATLRLALGALGNYEQTSESSGCTCVSNIGDAAVAAGANIVIEVEGALKDGTFKVLKHTASLAAAAALSGTAQIVAKVNGVATATVALKVVSSVTINGDVVTTRRLLADEGCNTYTWGADGAEVQLCGQSTGNVASRVPIAYAVYAVLAMILLAFYY